MLEPYLLRPFEPGRGLQEQLREHLVDALLDGALPPGQALPSTRELARVLGVSRNTVLRVYERLAHDGFLAPARRRGHFVHEAFARRQQGLRPRLPALVVPDGPARRPDWSHRLRTRTAPPPAPPTPADWRAYLYPFVLGQVEHDERTVSRWRACNRLATTGAHLRGWIDDRADEDDPLLVEQILQRVLPRRGIRATPDQILVTAGRQGALHLLAMRLGGPGTVVGLEEPGQPDARRTFALAGCERRALAVDADGLVVDEQLAGCDLVLCTPSHQAPTGVTMPLARRIALLERARAHDLVVVEDDGEPGHHPLGSNQPALRGLDGDGRVIHLGSLSRTLLPGLRLGFMVADKPLVAALRALRRFADPPPPLNNQRAMALFLSLGHHDEHAGRRRERLAAKWREFERGMATHLPAFRYHGAPGGPSIWVLCPSGLDARALAARAARRGVLVEPGEACYADPDPPMDRLRIGLGAIPAESIGPGLRALADAWREGEPQPAD